MSSPYFERLEDVRSWVVKILKESGSLTIQEIFEMTSDFRIPTTRHLVAVLTRDPKKRFKCENRVWRLD